MNVRAVLISLSSVAVLLTGTGLAQPLAELAPAETLISIGYRAQPGVLLTLDDDLAALDWPRAGRTLDELGRILGEMDPDRLPGDTGAGLLDMFTGPDGLLPALTENCPAALDTMRSPGFTLLGDQALLTLSAGAVNPLPAFTALSRLAPTATGPAEDFQNALVDCLGEDATALDESGIAFYVVDTGGDLPLVFGMAEDLFFAGTNPDVVRGVIRRSRGSSEPSLADSELSRRAASALEPGGLSFGIDFAGIAAVAESFRGMAAGEPETAYLFDRLTAALRTLGGAFWHMGLTPEGILSESILAVNPAGGDDELAELLLCPNCRVTPPALLPAGSVMVSGRLLPLRDIFRYVQGWLDGLAQVTGQPLDLKAMLEEEAGLDIDKALFDWIGDELYTAVLQPPSDRLASLLYGGGQVFLIPVTDPDTARAGLDHASEVLGPLLKEAASGGDMSDLAGLPLDVVTRSYDYRGVTIERSQWGPTFDIGTAFVGGYLAIGRPARALETLVDTAQGGSGLLGSKLPSDLPERPLSFSRGDEGAILGGLGELISLVSQPLAFVLAVAAAEEAQSGPAGGDAPGMADVLHLTEILPRALGILARHVGSSTGYAEVRGNDVYRRVLTEVAW